MTTVTTFIITAALVTIMKVPMAMVVATAVKGVVVMTVRRGDEDVPGNTAVVRCRTNSRVESRRG